MLKDNLSPGDLRELVFIHVDRLKHSNTPDSSKVARLTVNFDIKEFGVLPVFPMGDKYILTDGNHRMEAAKAKGYVWMPCIILNSTEFQLVKGSKRTAQILFKVPEKPLYIK